jgi:ADP-ribose pyrophosphatase YjhB (NUDIX family)
VVLATVIVRAGRVLLCRRAIEPALGLWGIPQGALAPLLQLPLSPLARSYPTSLTRLAPLAGYQELGETARAGAAREALEEAGAVVAPGPLLAVYDVPGSVQLVYLARCRASPSLGPRAESSEVAWFAWCATPN